MAGLQRSAVSFRRQGSSGSVWDDKFLNSLNQLAKQQKKEDDEEKKKNLTKPEVPETSTAGAGNSSPVPKLTIERSRSNGGRGYRTGKVTPAIEPPSPRVSACGCCGAFGKSNNTRRRPPRAGKRVM